ncbi:MAG: hypothetical protein C0596_09455 [Marinilabiliales bacterium]|nr:MAG: hypothetical protein C0596_09455 [Marinilabiliales bacterium]
MITIEYTGFNIGSFISNNTEAFPSGFSSPNYLYPYESNSSLIEDVSLRFKTYFYDVELSVFDERIDDIRTLMEKYIEEDIIEKCVSIVLNEDVEGLTGSDLEEFIGESFECFMPRIEAINQLYDTEHNDYLENPYDRIDLVLNYLKQEQRVDIIKDLLIEEFEIPELYITDLLLKQITYTDTETYPAINSFIKSSFLDLSEIDNTNSSEQIGLYRRLYKTAMLINGLKLTNEMVSSIYTIFDEEIDKYDLLNIFNPESSTDALTKYCNLLTAVNYSHSYFADETDFFSFFIENDDFSSLGSDSVEFICAATGCNEDDFTAMNTVILPEDLYINWFESLIECTHVVKSLGTKAQTIIDLNKTDSALTYEHSENLRQIVKSKYSEDDWYSVASAIRNPLRELQRNALRDCIVLKDSSIDSAEDLYNILLIDPEMATCAKTSRIVQATLSAQLFIQRILMGLEDSLSFNDDQKAELEWRKSYSVWEANRKILFFPENWLDPELRHNKSPFFKEVEERLLQNDVDENTVLDAYYEYLDKLDEVSNLEILCAYRDGNIANESQTTHFIGRTYGIPYKYFYRKLVNNSYWTPWEEIQNGMKADAVKLAFWKGDLYMFWPELYMTSQAQEGFEEYYSAYELNNENQNKFTAVKLTWSVYKNGNWTKPVTSEDVYIEPQNRGKLTNYQLNIYPQSDIIKIRVSFDQDVQDENSCWRTATRGNFVFNGRRISFDYQRNDCGSFDRIYFNSTGKKKTKNNKLLLQRDGSAGPNFAISYTHIVGENNEFDTTPLPFYLFIRSGMENDVKYNIIYDNISYYMWDWRLKIDYRNAWYKPFVLEDFEHNKNFLSIPYLTTPNYIANTNASNVKYKIVNLYYPFVNDIREKLNNLGLNGLFSSEFQDQEPRELFYNLKVNCEDTNADFNSYFGAIDSRVTYTPEYEELVFTPSEIEDSPAIQDPYAIYNWEMFFHIPMLIADNLSRNMKFEEARKWYHLIFDPTIGNDDDGAPKKFWKIKPFRDLFDEDGGMSSPENVSDFMNMINSENAYDELISAWEDSPFNPHLVATLRPMSYMRSVVMKYVENLINWADMLFTKDTMEDINQATLLYILASEILGVKPQKLEGTLSDAMSYYDMKNEMDDLSNVYTMIDGILTVAADHNNVSTEQTAEFGAAGYMVSYFGIPNNSKMEEYWDTVADRLFKIRHCMNIQGIVRELPLAAPPIDPGAVAAAMASGADLSSALSTLSAPLPIYRFNYILQKAIEFTNDVKSLGNTMLSVLEKKDAEAMSLLRSANEQLLLKAMTIIREKAIEEATENIGALTKSRDNVLKKYEYYNDKKFINAFETASITMSSVSLILNAISAGLNSGAAVTRLTPQFIFGFPLYTSFGGEQISEATSKASGALSKISYGISSAANLSSTLGQYKQRKEEWDFQADQADKEYYQIGKQIDAANVRLAMAEKELENHLVQIEHRAAEYEFIKGKFTNKELYNWMKGQVSKLYQDAYKMAHKLALAAEKAYIFERQKDNYTSIISSVHWDGLKQGLLSGEKLSNELRKLELEYIENNTREIELSRDIPLSLMAPNALVELQTKGSCEFDIPEMLYDIDHPGHYLRRIKGVSISIPAVTGPYSGVTCKLNLLNNRFRKSTSV